MEDGPSTLFKDSSSLQKVSGAVAFIFAVAAVIMTAYYANSDDTAKGMLGGLDMNENIFNWHPVLMVTGTIFCMISATLSFRLLPLPKTIQKTFHGIFHTAAFICISIGLACVLTSNNNKSKNPYDTYFPNFTSIHSFIGIAVICLYGLNLLVGFFNYAIPNVDDSVKASFLPIHVFLGTFILFGSFSAVESGIMLMTSGCYYDVTKADVNPAENYHLLSDGCRLANSIGIVVAIAVFCCFYAMFRMGSASPQSTAEEK